MDGRGHKGAASKASKWSARLHWLPRLSAAIRTIVQTICRQLVEVDCHLCCTLHFELGQVRPQWMGRRQCWFCPGGDWNASGRYSIVQVAKLVSGLSPCLLVKAWIVLPGQNFYWGLLSALGSDGRYPIWFNSMVEFCQKMIHSIFDSILLYPRFNPNIIQVNFFVASIQKIIQFNSQGIIDTGETGKKFKNSNLTWFNSIKYSSN